MDNDLLKKYKRNLGTLTEIEVDFYDFSLKNYDLFLHQTINEIAKKFGTGLSFIYSFFEKLGIKSLKEYIFFLGVVLSEKKVLFEQDKRKKKKFERETLFQKTIENIYGQYRLLDNQLTKINQLADEIHQKKDIFFIGLGYSRLAVEDFTGLFTYITEKNMKVINNTFIDYEKRLKEINNNSLVIIYSVRAQNQTILNWTKSIYLRAPEAKTYLITTNTASKLIYYVNQVIEVDNLTKRLDFFAGNVLISPLSSYVDFNNLLKSIYFNKYKSELLKSEKFLNEMISWRNDKNAKK